MDVTVSGIDNDLTYFQLKGNSYAPYSVQLDIQPNRPRWVLRTIMVNSRNELRSDINQTYEGTSNRFANSGVGGYKYRLDCYREFTYDEDYGRFTGHWYVN